MRSLLIAICLFAPPAFALEFDDFQRDTPERSLFKPPEIHDGAGPDLNDRWPWKGIEVSVYSGLYPVFLAASQGVDVGIPFLPWASGIIKAEATAGLLLSGGIFDVGVRGHYDFSDSFGIYGELTGRWGIGELTIAEIFEDAFQPVVDAGIDNISGFGVGFVTGLEAGGRNVRFTAAVHYSALFVDTSVFVGDHRANLPTITINHFGFQLGMRIYLK